MTQIVTSALSCCGLVTAEGFGKHLFENKRYYFPKEKDWKKDFQNILDEQADGPYNCALIVLSSDQVIVKEIAEANGFKTIQEFFNPNSGNQCYIMTRIENESKEYWEEKDCEEEEEDY